MKANITPPELNALPAHISTIRTLWPQILTGVVFAVSAAAAVVYRDSSAVAIALLCGLIFGITCSYLMAMRRGNVRLMGAINWIGGFATAGYFAAVSPDLLPVSILCVLEGVVYAMSANKRQAMRAGLLAAFGVLCGAVLITQSARLGWLQLGFSLSPAVTAALTAVFVLGIGGDILQRLWRYFMRIESAVGNLQHANAELESAKQALQQRLNERTQLLEISRSVSSTQDLASLLRNTLRHLKSVVEYGHASVLLLQDGELRALSSTGDIPLEQSQLSAPLENTPHRAAVIATRQPVLVNDLRADPRLTQLIDGALPSDTATQLGLVIGSWLGVPLIVRGDVIGILSIMHPTPGRFTQHDADMALAFANQVAGLIDSAHLQDEATKSLVHAERNRLARELHDSVSQSLFGIVLGTRTALDQLDKSTEISRTALLYSVDLANIALAEMRALIFTLRPETLEREGLLAALQKQVDMLSPRHNIHVALESDGIEPDIPMDIKEALYRIATEGVQNAIRHAEAKDVIVRLARHSGHISIEIEDNGKGFDSNADYRDHLGLKSMRERSAEQGGTLHIDSAPGAGTRVTAILPVLAVTPKTHAMSAIV